MAVTATLNVSGVAALRYILVDTTTFYFTNAVDGQRLTLTLQQDGTGSRTVVSGNCPGIAQPNATAGADTTQVLVYDAQTNAWASAPVSNALGNMVLQTTTTNTALAWTRGIYGISGAAATTLTITNPVAGSPGVGNDGEIMYFCLLTAHAHAVTMTTTQSINGSSTTATATGAVAGNGFALMAFGGKVYLIAQSNITTTSGVTLT